jgi:hypothetical protein
VSYYTVQHDEGDFWLQESDEKFAKSNDKILFKPFEKPVESAGPLDVTATASSSERYHDWGDAPDDGGWVVPAFLLVELLLVNLYHLFCRKMRILITSWKMRLTTIHTRPGFLTR